VLPFNIFYRSSALSGKVLVRPGDVLDLLLAQILEAVVEPVAHLVADYPADAGTTRLSVSGRAATDEHRMPLQRPRYAERPAPEILAHMIEPMHPRRAVRPGSRLGRQMG
jgi:hypothetical protein